MNFALKLEKSDKLKNFIKKRSDYSKCVENYDDDSVECKAVVEQSLSLDLLTGRFSNFLTEKFVPFLKTGNRLESILSEESIGEGSTFEANCDDRDGRDACDVVSVRFDGPGLELERRFRIPELLRDFLPVSISAEPT